MVDEPKIKIDEVEYHLSELSETATALAESLHFTENELIRARALVAVLETAKAGYQKNLREQLPDSHKSQLVN
jgi:hypothetical protein